MYLGMPSKIFANLICYLTGELMNSFHLIYDYPLKTV